MKKPAAMANPAKPSTIRLPERPLFVDARVGLRSDDRFFLLRLLKSDSSSNILQALTFRKLQRRGMKQLLDGQFSPCQTLLIRVLEQCFQRLAIRCDAVGPEIFTH